MTLDYMVDLYDDGGVFGITPWRCLICGEITDPVIAANRLRGAGRTSRPKTARAA
jgi:hypothetical protein